MKKCPYCAEEIQDDAVKCKHCGEWLDENSKPSIIPAANTQIIIQSKRSKGTAALLAIFLGGIGIHKFYLNQAGWGVVYILFCFTFIPAILGFIEGLIFATMSNEDFDRIYNQFYSLKPIMNQKNESTIISSPSKVTKYSAVVGWSSAKLRLDSSATSSVIGHLPQGTKVEVVDQSGEWVQVNVAQMQLQGWMFKNSLDDSGSGEDENIDTLSSQSKPNDTEKLPFYKIIFRTCLEPEKAKPLHQLILVLFSIGLMVLLVIIGLYMSDEPLDSVLRSSDKVEESNTDSQPSVGSRAVIKGDLPVCTNKFSLDEMIKYADQGDNDAVMKVINGEDCFMPQKGTLVIIDDTNLLDDIIVIRKIGSRERLWTFRDNVNY